MCVPTVQEEGKKPQDATSMHPRQLCHIDDWAGKTAGNSTPVHSKCEFSGGFWELPELGTVTILPSLIQKKTGDILLRIGKSRQGTSFKNRKQVQSQW